MGRRATTACSAVPSPVTRVTAWPTGPVTEAPESSSEDPGAARGAASIITIPSPRHRPEPTIAATAIGRGRRRLAMAPITARDMLPRRLAMAPITARDMLPRRLMGPTAGRVMRPRRRTPSRSRTPPRAPTAPGRPSRGRLSPSPTSTSPPTARSTEGEPLSGLR